MHNAAGQSFFLIMLSWTWRFLMMLDALPGFALMVNRWACHHCFWSCCTMIMLLMKIHIRQDGWSKPRQSGYLLDQSLHDILVFLCCVSWCPLQRSMPQHVQQQRMNSHLNIVQHNALFDCCIATLLSQKSDKNVHGHFMSKWGRDKCHWYGEQISAT